MIIVHIKVVVSIPLGTINTDYGGNIVRPTHVSIPLGTINTFIPPPGS